jgi:hypothetical protein
VQSPTHNRGYTLQGARVSVANADSRYREDFPLTFPSTVTSCKTLERYATNVTNNNNDSWGNNRQSDPRARVGYLARNQLERLPLIILGIASSDPRNMHNIYTKANKAR